MPPNSIACFADLLNSEERIERITFEVIEDCALDGTVVLELRYSPT